MIIKAIILLLKNENQNRYETAQVIIIELYTSILYYYVHLFVYFRGNVIIETHFYDGDLLVSKSKVKIFYV